MLTFWSCGATNYLPEAKQSTHVQRPDGDEYWTHTSLLPIRDFAVGHWASVDHSTLNKRETDV